MSDKVIYGMFDDDQDLLKAASAITGKGVAVKDVFSPFPVHGLDPIIGVKRTRLGIVAFMFGIGGTSLAMLGLWYFMIHDWPMNIGGKPSFAFYTNVPSFVPVMFEFTIFCASHGMALTYLIRNRTLPGMLPRNPDPRTTDDKFVMELRVSENHDFSGDQLSSMLKENGASEITEKDI